MRKIQALFLGVLISLLFTACSFEICDICNKPGADNTVQAVTEWKLCDDCYYDFLSDYDDDNEYEYDYDYDYDDEDDYDDDFSYSTDNCIDCGKSVPSGRYYCDKCLGYGTCQDCGKSIDSDRFYCDKCLGYGTCQDCGKSIASDRFYCDSCLFD